MFDSNTAAKWIIVIGLGIAALGVLVWAVGRLGLPLGRLPGDIRIERPGLQVYFPCASTILISLILTIALNVLLRLLRR
jgi:hypothetical protein